MARKRDLIVYLDSDNALRIPRLENNVTGEAITDASITAYLKEPDDSLVEGQDWPLSLAHTGDGEYVGILEHGLEVEVGSRYTVQVTATSPSVGRRTWTRAVLVRRG